MLQNICFFLMFLDDSILLFFNGMKQMIMCPPCINYIRRHTVFICLAIGGNNFKYLVKVASARFPYYQRVVFLLCNSETNFTRCYFETMSLSCSSFNSYLIVFFLCCRQGRDGKLKNWCVSNILFWHYFPLFLHERGKLGETTLVPNVKES